MFVVDGGYHGCWGCENHLSQLNIHGVVSRALLSNRDANSARDASPTRTIGKERTLEERPKPKNSQATKAKEVSTKWEGKQRIPNDAGEQGKCRTLFLSLPLYLWLAAARQAWRKIDHVYKRDVKVCDVR